jgi:hypothetical protein
MNKLQAYTHQVEYLASFNCKNPHICRKLKWWIFASWTVDFELYNQHNTLSRTWFTICSEMRHSYPCSMPDQMIPNLSSHRKEETHKIWVVAEHIVWSHWGTEIQFTVNSPRSTTWRTRTDPCHHHFSGLTTQPVTRADFRIRTVLWDLVSNRSSIE